MKKCILTMVLAMVACVSWANHWVVDDSQFANYMTVTCVVQINGEEQYSTQLELGSFCGNEVRGSIYGKKTPTNRYFFMLPCWGESGEEFNFRLYDAEHDIELDDYVCSTVLVYNQNGYGGLSNPYVLNFEGGPSGFHFITAGNWSTASNWQGGALPGTGDMVFIDANCTLNIDAEVTDLTVNDGSTLTLQTGRTLTVTGELVNAAETGLVIEERAQLINASANVSATVEKNIVAYGSGNPDGWYTIASPINTMTISGSGFLTPNYDLYRLNETRIGGEWENYKDNTNTDFIAFENGRGYLYANDNTFSPAFTGVLNNAAVSYAVTYTERTDGLSGFNLIGNPFPHAIYKGAGGAIDDVCLASGYYTLTNEGAWHVHTYEDAILPGQGILVKTTEAVTLGISKSNTVASAESGGAKSAFDRLDIIVAGAGVENRAYAYFGPGVGLNKMRELSDQVSSMWIRDNGRDYAIAHVDNGCESLDVFFHNRQNADFKFMVNVRDTQFSYLRLVDNLTGAIVDLLQQPEYEFHANGNEIDARFKLVFKVTTEVEEASGDAPYAYFGNGQIIIADVDENATLQIVDLMGRVMFSGETRRCLSTSGMAPGAYVLRLINGNDIKIQKLIIQ